MSLLLQEASYESSTVGRDFYHGTCHGTRRHIINLRFLSLEELRIVTFVAAIRGMISYMLKNKNALLSGMGK